MGKLIIITLYVYICVPLQNGGKQEYVEKAGTAAFELGCSFTNTDSLIRETIKRYGVDLEYNSVKAQIETMAIKCN
jgi:hypothetical protein